MMSVVIFIIRSECVKQVWMLREENFEITSKKVDFTKHVKHVYLLAVLSGFASCFTICQLLSLGYMLSD